MPGTVDVASQRLSFVWQGYSNKHPFTQVRDCEFVNFTVWFRVAETPYKYPNDARILGLQPFVFPWYDMEVVGNRDFYPETWQLLHDPAVTEYEGKPPPYKDYTTTVEYKRTAATYYPGSEPRWYEFHHLQEGGSGAPPVPPHPGDSALKNTKMYGLDMQYALQHQVRPSLIPSGTCWELTSNAQTMCEMNNLYDGTTYEFQMQETCIKDYLNSPRYGMDDFGRYVTELGTTKTKTKDLPLPELVFRIPEGDVRRLVSIVLLTYSEWLFPNLEYVVDGSVYPWNGVMPAPHTTWTGDVTTTTTTTTLSGVETNVTSSPARLLLNDPEAGAPGPDADPQPDGKSEDLGGDSFTSKVGKSAQTVGAPELFKHKGRTRHDGKTTARKYLREQAPPEAISTLRLASEDELLWAASLFHDKRGPRPGKAAKGKIMRMIERYRGGRVTGASHDSGNKGGIGKPNQHEAPVVENLSDQKYSARRLLIRDLLLGEVDHEGDHVNDRVAVLTQEGSSSPRKETQKPEKRDPETDRSDDSDQIDITALIAVAEVIKQNRKAERRRELLATFGPLVGLFSRYNAAANFQRGQRHRPTGPTWHPARTNNMHVDGLFAEIEKVLKNNEEPSQELIERYLVSLNHHIASQYQKKVKRQRGAVDSPVSSMDEAPRVSSGRSMSSADKGADDSSRGRPSVSESTISGTSEAGRDIGSAAF